MQPKPGTFDLDLYQGDTNTWEFRLWDDLAKTAPHNLATSTVLAQVRRSPGGRILFTLDLTVVLPHRILAALPATAWDTIDVCQPLQKASWDLQVTDAEDKVQTVLKGDVFITADVSVEVTP